PRGRRRRRQRRGPGRQRPRDRRRRRRPSARPHVALRRPRSWMPRISSSRSTRRCSRRPWAATPPRRRSARSPASATSRCAGGRRTREIVGNFGDKDWGGEIAAPSLQKAATEGAFGTRAEQLVKGFTGRPRAAVLSGIALFHPAAHLGEAVTVRSAGGFGTG